MNSRGFSTFIFLVMVSPHLLCAQVADKRVVIQPIQVGSSDRSLLMNSGLRLFEAETDKIWAQAGIDVQFLPAVQYYDDNFLDITSSFGSKSFAALAGNPGHGQSADPNVLNLFFVRSIDNSSSVYGYSFQNNRDLGSYLNGMSIAESTLTFAGGIGRLDTLAHELGRNLGLPENKFGAGSADNLMTVGGSRTVPSSVSDISPDGLQLDKLTGDLAGVPDYTKQVWVARDAPFVSVIPEPAFSALGAAVVVMLFGAVRGSRPKRAPGLR